jgi:hypothetical protein
MFLHQLLIDVVDSAWVVAGVLLQAFRVVVEEDVVGCVLEEEDDGLSTFQHPVVDEDSDVFGVDGMERTDQLAVVAGFSVDEESLGELGVDESRTSLLGDLLPYFCE